MSVQKVSATYDDDNSSDSLPTSIVLAVDVSSDSLVTSFLLKLQRNDNVNPCAVPVLIGQDNDVISAHVTLDVRALKKTACRGLRLYCTFANIFTADI